MNIDKKYTLFEFRGKTPLGISSLTQIANVKTIFKVSDNGVSWEAWTKGSLFNAFDNFNPLTGYYLVSENQNPNYELYNVEESSPLSVAQVDKRYKIASWNCDNKPIVELNGPNVVYAVNDIGTGFNSWLKGSLFPTLQDFQNEKGYILFSPSEALPYELYSCCLINPSQQFIEITSGNVANGLGMTLVSSLNNKIYYDVINDFDGLPSQLGIYVSSNQVAAVTYNSPYNGTPFVFEMTQNGETTRYCGSFDSSLDRIDF